MGGLKNSSEGLYIFGLGRAPVYYGMRIFYYGRPQKFFGFLAWEQHQFIMGGGFFIMGGLKNSSEGLYIFGLGTAPVYYGRSIFHYGKPQKFLTIALDFWPGNSTSLLWDKDFLLWEASKILHNHFGFLAWEQHQFIMGGGFFIMGGLKYSSEGLYIFGLGTAPVYYGRRIFYYGRPEKILQKDFTFLAWEQHQFIMGGGFFIMGGTQNLFSITLDFWPGNSTSLLWGGGFFIMGGLKNSSQSLWIFGLGTAPVYYGRRIFYYGRPQKFFRRTLQFWPGNSTSLLWEEDFLLWEASKILHNHFGFLAWEQHQFIMGGAFLTDG